MPPSIPATGQHWAGWSAAAAVLGGVERAAAAVLHLVERAAAAVLGRVERAAAAVLRLVERAARLTSARQVAFRSSR